MNNSTPTVYTTRTLSSTPRQFISASPAAPYTLCMELILTCRQCGHREAGNTERALMTKIRMWNHLTHAHPTQTEVFNFKQRVEEHSSA